MQDRLGVAVGLGAALEDQVAGGLEGDRLEVGRHWPVEGIAGVLAVHDGGHALHGLQHLRLGGDAVQQPVGDVLAGDAQRGAVLHQADVVDVRHLGAADALIDPAHHVAEDALGVVVELLLDVLGRPATRSATGMVRMSSSERAGGATQLVLAPGDVDLVVVHRVQRRCGGRGYPGGVGAGLRMGDLLRHHVGHAVGHRPHALADLRPPGRPQASPISTFQSS